MIRRLAFNSEFRKQRRENKRQKMIAEINQSEKDLEKMEKDLSNML